MLRAGPAAGCRVSRRRSRGDTAGASSSGEDGRLAITPLFLVLLVIESTDVLFAVDSVPAIFGITPDPFIVFTSNIFAILGLRALYFLLAGVHGQCSATCTTAWPPCWRSSARK